MLCPILVVHGADAMVKFIENWRYLHSIIRYAPCKLKGCGKEIFVHVIEQLFDRNHSRHMIKQLFAMFICEKSRIISIWSHCNCCKIPVKSYSSVAPFWQLDSSEKSWKHKMQLFPWQWLLKPCFWHRLKWLSHSLSEQGIKVNT